MQTFDVLSPEGLDSIERRGPAPRLDSLHGKTVCEIWNGVFKGDVTFPIIRAHLQARYPGVRIVPYTEFPHAPGTDNPARQRALAQEIAALVKQKGGDAVISGNGA
ncbi:MAG TPA: hypothetical protein VGP15_18770 [Burkholderiales bacterium]|jgi:hypothetical protein|nr:hypothetical protein [Burkholderiales bacterium]